MILTEVVQVVSGSVGNRGQEEMVLLHELEQVPALLPASILSSAQGGQNAQIIAAERLGAEPMGWRATKSLGPSGWGLDPCG